MPYPQENFPALYRQTFAQVRCPARVAQAAAQPKKAHRWRWLALAAAPLLLAAGVAASQVQFTNLRETPHPSFAPTANTGYAVSYTAALYPAAALKLPLQPPEPAAPTESDAAQRLGTHGWVTPVCNTNEATVYSSWQQAGKAVGLPILQNPILEQGPLTSACGVTQLQPVQGADDRSPGYALQSHRVGVFPLRDGEGGLRQVQLYGGVAYGDYLVELNIEALTDPNADADAAPAQVECSELLWQQFAGLTRDAEEYTLPDGTVVCIPVCTSNPQHPNYGSTAYFTHDGLLYRLRTAPASKVWNQTTSGALRAALKEVLDAFAAPAG